MWGKIDSRAELCVKCGVRQLVDKITKPRRRNRIIAILFAWFFGFFGGHKYYLGQIGLCILYTLFFWTLIPAIISFIEFVILISMSDAEFERKYNNYIDNP